MKILNLYAGIGGNRKLWNNVDITAIENNEEIASIYKDFYPNDEVIITDAHQYLLDHYKEYDFIWSSPPCQSHSKMNRTLVHRGQISERYPDMRLYQEILFLKEWFDGKWIVENVDPYYETLIPGKKVGRHLFWSNFKLGVVGHIDTPSVGNGKQVDFESAYDMTLKNYNLETARKDVVIHNCVHPKIGKHILDRAQDIIIKSDTEQTALKL